MRLLVLIIGLELAGAVKAQDMKPSLRAKALRPKIRATASTPVSLVFEPGGKLPPGAETAVKPAVSSRNPKAGLPRSPKADAAAEPNSGSPGAQASGADSTSAAARRGRDAARRAGRGAWRDGDLCRRLFLGAWNICFGKCPGVLKVESGYIGGNNENPTYEEVVQPLYGMPKPAVWYSDPAKVSYETLARLFFETTTRPRKRVAPRPRRPVPFREIFYTSPACRRRPRGSSPSCGAKATTRRDASHLRSRLAAEDYHQRILQAQRVRSRTATPIPSGFEPAADLAGRQCARAPYRPEQTLIPIRCEDTPAGLSEVRLAVHSGSLVVGMQAGLRTF